MNTEKLFRRLGTALSAVVSAASSAAVAATLTVGEGGYPTIDAAIAAARDGDTVALGEGTYNVQGEILFVTNAITVKGLGPDKTIVHALNPNEKTKIQGKHIYRRCFLVQNRGAVVRDLAVENAFWYAANGWCYSSYVTNAVANMTSGKGTNGQIGGEIILEDGVVDNCLITGTRHGTGTGDGCGTLGGGVFMTGGILTNCVIRGCKAVYNNSQATGAGGGVWMSNGLIVDCVLSNNYASATGAGVHLYGGTMRRCRVVDNRPNASEAKAKGAVYAENGAVIEDCVICDHTSGGFGYAGVYLSGNNAVVRNTFIGNNRGLFRGNGVYGVGRAVNCTVAGCTSVLESDKGPGVYLNGSKALALNCVVTGCGGFGGQDVLVDSGTFRTNLTDTAYAKAVAGDGNVFGKDCFVDAANGDYHLAVGSRAIGAALPQAAVPRDLDGVARDPVTPDMGAWEYVPAKTLVCSFNVSADVVLPGAGVELTAAVDGTDKGVTYAWYVDGASEPASTDPAFTLANVGVGAHRVKLVVSDGTDTAVCERENAVAALADHTYVATDGGNVFPYATRATAARRVQDAIDACACSAAKPGLVEVAPGDYPVGGLWNIINKPLRLVSTDGPSVTSLYGENPNGVKADGSKVRRVLNLSHEQALVSGFTVSNGWWFSYTAGESGPGAMRMSAGTVTNCVFTLNRGSDVGGAIEMSGGCVVGCDIHDNVARYNNDTVTTKGGGVYMTGGTVSHCEIHRNWAANNNSDGSGSGVWMSGGVLADSYVYENFTRGSQMTGVGVTAGGSALVERCAITNNSHSGWMTIVKDGGFTTAETTLVADKGAGLYLKPGGTARNCLIFGNYAGTYGAGVYMTGGTLEFCTVTCNSTANMVASGLYVDGTAANVRYNVLYGNGAGLESEAFCNLQLVKASVLDSNLIGTKATVGTNTIYDDPLLEWDETKWGFTLGAGSPAIDVLDEADVTTDFAGDKRPTDGDGDKVAKYDLGCFEAIDAASGPLRCAFSPTQTLAHDRAEVTFVASVRGSGSDGDLEYVWDFGGGVPVTPASAATVTVRFEDYASYPVSLTVRSAKEEAYAYVSDCVKIGTCRLYVDEASVNPVWPYATRETAAQTLYEAMTTLIPAEGAVTCVEVADGTYVNWDKWLQVTSPIRLTSVNGPAVTKIVGNSPGYRQQKVLNVNNPQAFVAGFTLTGGTWEGNSWGDYGGAVRVTDGVVSNCVLDANEGGNLGGQLDMQGGLVVDCQIINGSARANGNFSVGEGAVYMTGGSLVRCVISNNVASAGGGGISMNGENAVVDGCLIAGNVTSWQRQKSITAYPAGGVWLKAGTLKNSVITGNRSYGDWGGVRQDGGTMYNCLVAGNWSATTKNQGYGCDGKTALAYNCTFVTNGLAGVTGAVVAQVKSGTVVNSIFADSAWAGTELLVSGGSVTYSRYPGATGTGNVSADPCFRKPERGDWRIHSDSPCRNAGSDAVWGESLPTAVDLLGEPRKVGAHVDMGCCECLSAGMTLIVR